MEKGVAKDDTSIKTWPSEDGHVCANLGLIKVKYRAAAADFNLQRRTEPALWDVESTVER